MSTGDARFPTEDMKERIIERWQNALRVLKAMTEHEIARHFDMSTWGRKTACGTVACLAGHCALDPWFNERGFTGSWGFDAFTQHTYLRFDKFSPAAFFQDPLDGPELFWNQRHTHAQMVEDVEKHIARLQQVQVEVS